MLAVVSLTAWSIVFPMVRAEAGSLVVPAWSFARGNVRVYADPEQYADAGPVVGSGPRQPWGWTVEYDVEVPVAGDYTFQICCASAEPRPMQFFVDNWNMTKCCEGVTLDPASSGQPDRFTWNSSGARWQGVNNQGGQLMPRKLTKGGHTIKLTRRGPLPHLVALCLATKTPFPKDWRPPQYTVRDIESIPAEHRKAFQGAGAARTAFLEQEIKRMIRLFGPRYPDGPQHLKQLAELEKKQNADEALIALQREVMAFWTAPSKPAGRAGSLTIPAWAFDRGNVRIHASPDQFADAGPLVGNEPDNPEEGVVQYDIDFPATGQYTLQVSYASAEARPVEVFLDGKSMGKCCYDVTYGSAPFEIPVKFTFNSSGALKKWEWLKQWGGPRRMSIAKGKHTLKFSRNGPLPNLAAFRLDSSAAFPKDWKQPPRRVRHLDSVPVAQRSVFLPPGSVNIAALRLAIEDMIRTLGPQYPGGPQYLKRLAEFEKKQSAVFVTPGRKWFSATRTWASEKDMPEDKRTIEEALKSLRREAMLAHPALKFDKLLFVKRPSEGHNTYADSGGNMEAEAGKLCILSPAAPDGKITNLVPELDGGRFSRFDLSFDAKKVVFGYKKKDKPYRIFEIDIDPLAGKMVPGSLRQLTRAADGEEAFIRCNDIGKRCPLGAFDDMAPCYLPDGRIMCASTRSMRGVFCAGSMVTTLYVMDADGKNMHCLSGSPLNEVDPCLLDDGRVVYTRWEYVDKGLGNGQSLWAMRPDGSGVDHVYKNSIIRPAQLLYARSIPGSRRIVTVGAPHVQGRLGGPVILVDTRVTRRDLEAMTCITPEIHYPCMFQATWDRGFFRETHPFSEKFFLTSHSPAPKGTQYGIYALDAWGNRAELYSDPEISCFQPTPLRPRRRPNGIASVETVHQTQGKTGTVFVQDVYQGMTGIERGKVKYLRVMGALPWPWNEKGIFRVGLGGNVHRKKVYGIAKVHEDGSACFTVPAGENVFFQALDEEYMQLQHMPTFINLMPGENRSCIGCHEHRSSAPKMTTVLPQAMDYPVQSLSPQPGETGPVMVHYADYVQPILDKHCVGCHGGSNPKGHLDLTGETTDEWNRSYENLVGKGLVSFRDCRYGRSGFRPEPPLSFGSHLSKLVERIREDPCKGKLTNEEFIRITTWIDANAPYLGRYGVQGGSAN